MASIRATDPQAEAVGAALRTTTESLASSLAQHTQTAPEWSDFEWRVAKAVAAIHGVSPLLAGSLRWQGPPEWVRFLAEQKAHTIARHRRIEELLRLIDSRARDAGVAVVALKGAELHARGLYAPGERPMADVDLLVAERDSDSSCRMLESLGFHESLVTWKHRAFDPDGAGSPETLGEHAGNPMKIELHTQIAEALPVSVVRVTHVVFPSSPRPGLNAYPSRAALMIHLLLHAAGTMVFRALRLLHLHDLALLSSNMTDADWDEVLKHSARGERYWWALPPLELTARYYPASVPARVLAALSAACPWLLGRLARRRALSDVSLSHLWVDAFPGIEWAQSIPEMLAYAASRLRPSAETLGLRKKILESHPAGEGPWQRLSQRQRVLRWLTSRPARDETSHTVRAALDQTQ